MPSSSRSPHPLDACVLAVAAAVSALVVRAAGGLTLGGPWWMTLVAAASMALIFGMPVVVFLLGRGKATLPALLTAGVVVAMLPLLVFAFSGVLGLHLRWNEWAPIASVLERGVPFPYFGLTSWPRFVHLQIQAILVGVGTALMFWLARVRGR